MLRFVEYAKFRSGEYGVFRLAFIWISYDRNMDGTRSRSPMNQYKSYSRVKTTQNKTIDQLDDEVVSKVSL